MAGGDERKRELLWFEYRGQQFMVPEDDAKEYKLSFRFLRLDNTTMVLLNNVANLVDVKSGLTTCDKRRLQELLGPVGNTKADSIKIDLVPVQGGVGAGAIGTAAGGAAVVTHDEGKAQMDGILAAWRNRAAVDSPLDVYQTFQLHRAMQLEQQSPAAPEQQIPEIKTHTTLTRRRVGSELRERLLH